MRRKIKKLRDWYRNSRYTNPITVFVLLFFMSGALMFLVEIRFNKEVLNVIDGLWWSLVTFSTTGYGDKVPVTLAGKLIAGLTIFLGIAAMSFLSGTLASVFVDRNTKARRGLVDFRRLKDHFIICGWKDHIKDILLDIVTFSGDFASDKIVIISNVASEKIEELKEEKQLSALRFVRGDYFSESALSRANVKGAGKVLILADTFESGASSEVDSKTVMTVLTIRAMDRDVYICAELLDRKYESYLKQAMCDEILFSLDFSRRILANTSTLSGMSHIMFELLSQEREKSRLITLDIPNAFVNKPYAELRSSYLEVTDKVLIGLLENAGSPNRMKMESLRDAQKTSDVSELVTNLQKVKKLEVNRAVILPHDDYLVQRYSRAIIIEGNEAGARG